jgi:hypothetical protein
MFSIKYKIILLFKFAQFKLSVEASNYFYRLKIAKSIRNNWFFQLDSS